MQSYIRVYNGSGYDFKPMSVYSGASWDDSVLKIWDGSEWIPELYLAIDTVTSKIPSTITNFSAVITQDNVDAQFWTYVETDGSNISIVDDNGDQLNFDVVYINTTDEEVEVRFLITSLSSSTSQRFYIKLGSLGANTPSNAYRSSMEGYWSCSDTPSGSASIIDRTSNGNDMTSYNMDSSNLVAGVLNKAYTFNDTDEHAANTVPAVTSYPFTMLYWAKSDGAVQDCMFAMADTAVTNKYVINYYYDVTSTNRSIVNNAASIVLNSPGVTDNVYQLMALKVTSSSISSSVDAGTPTTSTHSITFPSGLDNTSIGGLVRTSVAYYGGELDETRIYSEALSDDEITTIYNNESSPSTFWDVQSYSLKITTVTSKIPSTITNYSAVLTEDNVTTAFWDDVETDGSNIYITDASGTQLEYDVVYIDTTNEILQVRFLIASLSSSVATDFYIKLGTHIPNTPSNAYRSSMEGYWTCNESPVGASSVIDRTSNANHMSPNNMDATNLDANAPLGRGYTFNGTDEWTSINSAVVTSYPLTILHWNWWNITEYRTGGLHMADAVTDTDYFATYCHNTLGFLAQVTATSSSFANSDTGRNSDEYNFGASVYTSSVSRIAYCNAVAGTEDTTSISFPTGLDNTSIGAVLRNTTTEYGGKVSEVRIYSEVLSADEITTIYNNESSPSTFFV